MTARSGPGKYQKSSPDSTIFRNTYYSTSLGFETVGPHSKQHLPIYTGSWMSRIERCFPSSRYCPLLGLYWELWTCQKRKKERWAVVPKKFHRHGKLPGLWLDRFVGHELDNYAYNYLPEQWRQDLSGDKVCSWSLPWKNGIGSSPSHFEKEISFTS